MQATPPWMMPMPCRYSRPRATWWSTAMTVHCAESAGRRRHEARCHGASSKAHGQAAGQRVARTSLSCPGSQFSTSCSSTMRSEHVHSSCGARSTHASCSCSLPVGLKGYTQTVSLHSPAPGRSCTSEPPPNRTLTLSLPTRQKSAVKASGVCRRRRRHCSARKRGGQEQAEGGVCVCSHLQALGVAGALVVHALDVVVVRGHLHAHAGAAHDEQATVRGAAGTRKRDRSLTTWR